jgi:hypothetical protein
MPSIDQELDAEVRESFTAALRRGRYIAIRPNGEPVTADELDAMTQEEFERCIFRDAPQ